MPEARDAEWAVYGTAEKREKRDRGQTNAAPAALLVAICGLPLLIGSDCSWVEWCARLVGWDRAAVDFQKLAHTLQFALVLTATTNLTQFFARFLLRPGDAHCS